MRRFSLLFGAFVIAVSVASYLVLARNEHRVVHSTNIAPSGMLDSPLSNATVSFGAWMMPLDRFPNVPPPPPTNHHELIPQIATIKAGGAVNFIIAGLHQVVVYADGTQPSDINTALLNPPPVGTSFPPLINDPNGRLYRGPDPRVLFPNIDRVEVVHFATPGTYLVICGVLPHFNQGMYGFVRVLP